MAIPHPPEQPAARSRTILRVSVAAALISCSLAIALWTGAIPGASPKAECPPAAAADCPRCEACPAIAALPEAPAADAPASPAQKPSRPALQRFSVCEAGSGSEPLVRMLSLGSGATPVIGVHCSARIELIAFDRGEPRRIATLEAAAPSDRNHSLRAGALLATDVSGDGANDLIAGIYRSDEHASQRGGTLYELRRTASGTFGDPRALAPLTVGAVVAFELDQTKGSELAVLQLHDARLARANEVVILRGGPAPVKLVALRAGIGSDQIAAVDLDLDLHPDLAVAGGTHPAEVMYLDVRGQPRQRIALEGGPASSLLVMDFDRDSHDDLLLGGSDARVLIARPTEPRSPRPLAALRDVERLQALDWNRDGKLDVVGRREKTLVAVLPTSGDSEPEVIEIASWLEPDFEYRALAHGLDGPASLVLIASPVQARGHVELWLASTPSFNASSAEVVPLPDAPVFQRFALP